jgi:hypothetical protein
VADIVQYRIQRWSLDGVKRAEINRTVDWFRPHDNFRYPVDIASEAHPPGLISIHQDNTGLLWTILRVPDRRWKSALGQRTNVYGRSAIGVLDREKYWDTIVEVIDPTSGKVIASTRVDAVLERFVHDRQAFQYKEDESGEPSVVIWQFRLINQTGRTP